MPLLMAMPAIMLPAASIAMSFPVKTLFFRAPGEQFPAADMPVNRQEKQKSSQIANCLGDMTARSILQAHANQHGNHQTQNIETDYSRVAHGQFFKALFLRFPSARQGSTP